jgi:DNA-binding NtrC family response regulator
MTEAVLAGRTILVVEDEGLIARELSNALESAGAEIITARGVMDATRIIESRKLSAAVLDFWLGVGVDCLRICDLVTEQGVPFLPIRATGYWRARRRHPSLASRRHRR